MNYRQFTRKSLYHALGPFQARRHADRVIGLFLTILIILNVIAVILETVESIRLQHESLFYYFEVFSVAIFTLEYFIRIWVSVEGREKRKTIARLKFMFTPLAIIDLAAVLPFFIPLFFNVDLRYLRALRLIRIARVFKLGRHSKSLKFIGKVIKNKAPDLMVTTGVGMILLVVSSSAMYFFEHDIQPEVFSSIPAAMWWAVSTLTTVGYGDIYPITVGGKIFGSFVSFLGVGLIAVPTSILGSGLIEGLDKTKNKSTICPHCEKNMNKVYKKAS